MQHSAVNQSRALTLGGRRTEARLPSETRQNCTLLYVLDYTFRCPDIIRSSPEARLGPSEEHLNNVQFMKLRAVGNPIGPPSTVKSFKPEYTSTWRHIFTGGGAFDRPLSTGLFRFLSAAADDRRA